MAARYGRQEKCGTGTSEAQKVAHRRMCEHVNKRMTLYRTVRTATPPPLIQKEGLLDDRPPPPTPKKGGEAHTLKETPT